MRNVIEMGLNFLAEINRKSRESEVGRDFYDQIVRMELDQKWEYPRLIPELETQVAQEGLRIGRVIQTAVRMAGEKVTEREAEVGLIHFKKKVGYLERKEKDWYWEKWKPGLRRQAQEEGLRVDRMEEVISVLGNPAGLL